jgi:MFS family permease
MSQMESQRTKENAKQDFLDMNFKNPKHFTWLLVGFASMGSLLSSLDQSLISGANLYIPVDLGLTLRQNSLVNSSMPLSAVGGALLLSPVNELLGRRMAIIISIILYTIGAAVEAGAQNFGMTVNLSGRVILWSWSWYGGR